MLKCCVNGEQKKTWDLVCIKINNNWHHKNELKIWQYKSFLCILGLPNQICTHYLANNLHLFCIYIPLLCIIHVISYFGRFDFNFEECISQLENFVVLFCLQNDLHGSDLIIKLHDRYFVSVVVVVTSMKSRILINSEK